MTGKKVPRGASVLRLRRLAFLGGEADEIVERRERRRRACARRDHDLLVGHRGRVAGGEDAGLRGGAARVDLDLAARRERDRALEDRKSVVEGKSVSIRVGLDGRRNIKKKK